MKRKKKVLLGAKKTRSGDVAPLLSRAFFVICLGHFLLALVPRKRLLERVEVERVEVGLNLHISVQ
jgi:hypothetical protein